MQISSNRQQNTRTKTHMKLLTKSRVKFIAPIHFILQSHFHGLPCRSSTAVFCTIGRNSSASVCRAQLCSDSLFNLGSRCELMGLSLSCASLGDSRIDSISSCVRFSKLLSSTEVRLAELSRARTRSWGMTKLPRWRMLVPQM